MADGNFKANHIRQKNVAGDVWLSEGSGTIPKWDEYTIFLESARERLTVSHDYAAWLTTADCACSTKQDWKIPRRHPVKINPSNHEFFIGIKGLWYHRCGQNCLCQTWLLCTKFPCRPFQRRTTKKCWLCISKRTNVYECCSRTGHTFNLRYCLSVFHSFSWSDQQPSDYSMYMHTRTTVSSAMQHHLFQVPE